MRDYSLIGVESEKAIEMGLADAEWYQSPVSRADMRELLVRKNWPATRDTLIWFGLIFGSGYLVYLWWGSWWVIFPYIVYSVLYASTSDSRWHESSHGTAFKTDWMNNVLYEISSFMIFRQSNVWRWSHTRHHSDTIIRGRDPEIAVPRPPQVKNIFKSFFGLRGAIPELRKMLLHASGKIDPEVATYLPESEYKIVILKARIYLLIYLTVIFLAIIYQTILPLMYVGLPTLLGSWLLPIYGLTQHAGLQENVLDHRCNSRTVYMNRVHRFLYWNMNYHVEHHMFPLVPYHSLPRLHQLIKDDCPEPSKSIIDAFREIIPAIKKQIKDPSYFVDRKLPKGAGRLGEQSGQKHVTVQKKVVDGKVEVCKVEELPKGEIVRFDFEQKTYAVYHTNTGNYYASDGICTHGNTHLSEGVVIDDMIECPKHNGRFSLIDGSPKRMPVCLGIKTFKVELTDGVVLLDVEELRSKASQNGEMKFKVVGNENVATYIKELQLEPLEKELLSYQPGQYIQLSIPPHKTSFSDFEISDIHREKWEKDQLFESFAENKIHSKRNYSLVTNPVLDNILKFNVRIALSPDSKNISAGAGSSYVFNLKAGDEVEISGPYGDFLIKDTDREMVYLGGGAGMAPIRSHLSYLLESKKTKRKISYWYGARSVNDLFYYGYFEDLSKTNPNFTFEVALSEQTLGDNWNGKTGFIHEALLYGYLASHPEPKNIEYYLCGPPAMVQAAREMLSDLEVPEEMIAHDEF
jgi:Na(+)-translocating NADH:ubiquinone oxidoreductase F subunit